MGLYVYCVVPPAHAPAKGLTGVDGWAVTLWRSDGLGAWVSESPARPEPSLARIREHNGVIEAAVSETVTPVPLRFGQWLPSEEAFRNHVTERAEKYRVDLQRFAGSLEFGIRALDPRDHAARNLPRPQGVTGRQYMAALRELYQARESVEPVYAELRRRIHEHFGPFVRAEHFENAAALQSGVAVVHLVERSQFDAYHAAVRELRREFEELRFLSSGPWPPYTFAADHG